MLIGKVLNADPDSVIAVPVRFMRRGRAKGAPEDRRQAAPPSFS
jgi:hypothetical protein